MKKILNNKVKYLNNVRFLTISVYSWIVLALDISLGILAVLSSKSGFNLDGWQLRLMIGITVIDLIMKYYKEHLEKNTISELNTKFLEQKKENDFIKKWRVSPEVIFEYFCDYIELQGKLKATLYVVEDEEVFPVNNGVTKLDSLRCELEMSYPRNHLIPALDIDSFDFFKLRRKEGLYYQPLEDKIGFSKDFSSKHKIDSYVWFVKIIRSKSKPEAVLLIESQEETFTYHNSEETITVDVNDRESAEHFSNYIDQLGVLETIAQKG